MLFSSMTFICLFLPIVCAIYWSVRKELRNTVLLLASIFFYAWGEPAYLAILFLTILINYAGAIGISRSGKSGMRKIILTLTILADLGFLVYFKYFNFLLGNLNALFPLKLSLLDVIMPIGISFYTFQALSYVVDVYRKEVEVQKNIYQLALYICLFPQLIAGPIVKYHDIKDQLDHHETSFDGLVYGIQRFIIGLSKKILIANTLGTIADAIFEQPTAQLDTTTVWLGAVAYSFQLFYDFSGYSDMAIGLGSMFGFHFLENFNYPYISKSITEFWRRWHISLSTWFKEYLYIPLGGNRVSPARNYLNLFLVFLATGIWHGASWNFVVWGLWNGAFILFEKISGWHKKEGGVILSSLHHIYTVFIFVVGWVMFRADTMTYARDYIKTMFGLLQPQEPIHFAISYYLDFWSILIFAVAVLGATPLFHNLLKPGERTSGLKKFLVNAWLLILFVLSGMSIASSSYNPFIYFRF